MALKKREFTPESGNVYTYGAQFYLLSQNCYLDMTCNHTCDECLPSKSSSVSASGGCAYTMSPNWS